MDFLNHVDRRNFLRLSGALGALAMLTGCSRLGIGSSGQTAGSDDFDLDKHLAALRKSRDIKHPKPPADLSGGNSSGMPAMVPRSYWGATSPTPSRLNRMTRITRMTVHHEGCPKANWTTAPQDVAKTLRMIQSSHRKRLRAGDIGYHYIIDRTGRIWEGRNLTYQGAHVRGNNEGNIGIMLMGNFDIQSPTEAQLNALERLSGTVIDYYNINPTRVYGHCDLVATRCPGRNLHNQLGAMRGLLAKA